MGGRWKTRTALAGLGFTLVAVPAQAQDLFGAIFGTITGHHQGRSYHPPTAYGSSADERVDPITRRPPSYRAPVASTPSGYCVRLCDGRYFPLPRATGVRLDNVKVCSALCPAASTQVFYGGAPERATASDGTRYADIDNAFTYRDKIVPDCSCTGNGPGGLAQIDVETDPTLRAGDVVATRAGLTVFRGSSQFPYRSADFTPVPNRSAATLNVSSLAALRVNPTAVSATPPQRLTADVTRPANEPRRRTTIRVGNFEERPVSFWNW